MTQERRRRLEARTRPQPLGDAVVLHLHREPDVEPRMKRRARQLGVQLRQRRVELRRRRVHEHVRVSAVEAQPLLQGRQPERLLHRRLRALDARHDLRRQRRRTLRQLRRVRRFALGDGDGALQHRPHPRARQLEVLGVVGERSGVGALVHARYLVLFVCVTPCDCS
jgi:hypothetical protein